MSKRSIRLAVLCGVAAFFVPQAQATIVVNGPQAFQDAVHRCLDMIRETEVDPAAVLGQVQNASHQVTIEPTAEPINSTTFANGHDARSPAAGGSGAGSDATVGWDPNNTTDEELGLARDPCASLMHELRHALDSVNGTLDQRLEPPPPSPDGIQHTEIEACRDENLYRRSHPPLPQRPTYGGHPLPHTVVF